MNVTTDEATRQLITSMASELQTTATKAFELYITGLRIDAALDLIAMIAITVFSGIGVKIGFDYAERTEPLYNHDESDSLLIAVFAGLIVMMISMAITMQAADLIQTIIIPEYTAMQEVISAVR